MNSPKELLDKISELQSRGNTIYRAGLFPSQRVHAVLPYRREDNNIFFSALIAFSLQQLFHHLPSGLQDKANRIIEAVRANYSYFQSDKGTYNFWEPGGSNFPNGWALHHLTWITIPDDTDDSSLIMLTNIPSKDDLLRYKHQLETHYGGNAKVSPLTPQKYRMLKAYPAFFGKKIRREMDVCVISNVLYLVCHYQLPWSSTDRDSVLYLSRVLEQKDYQKLPFQISPHYGNSSIILYHLARLIGSFDREELKPLKSPLILCLEQEQTKELSFMEGLLIKSSLLRMKIKTTPLDVPDEYQKHFQNFYFFQAGMLTAFQNSKLRQLAKNSIFHLKYQCEAYYWTLLLEYHLLAKAILNSEELNPGPPQYF